MFDERSISSDLYIEGPTPARYWGDQWLRVAEKIVKGLNRDLTDRVTNLEAAVADGTGSLPEASARTIAGEVSRLNGLLALYRMLTTEAIEEPEALRLQDLLPDVLRLHEHHADLGRVPVELTGDETALPVVVRRSALVRCLLVLFASAAGNALRAGSKSPVKVRYGGRTEDVFLRISGPAPRDQLLFTGDGSLVYAVRAALAHASGVVEGVMKHADDSDFIEYDLWMPAPAAARNRDQS